MIYIFILLLPLLLYAVFARIIIFHLSRYSINEKVTKQITAAFIAISLVLVVFTSITFFAIPWNSLSLQDIKNYFNFSPEFNQSQNTKINY